MKDQVVGMELVKQVTYLELSKRLKELGVKQDGLFSWIEYDNGEAHVELTKWAKTQYGGIGREEKDLFAAFTVAELGEKLKEWCKDANFCPLPLFDKQTKKWNNHYADDFIANTEADARAKMVAYLIKEGIIEVKKDV